MNDFLCDEIYKNTQRLRNKNQVEEKLLHQIVEGHKGYRAKLNKTLSKIEKTRQIIEREYFYMEKEMRSLGLNPPKKNQHQQSPPVPKRTNTQQQHQTNNIRIVLDNDENTNLNIIEEENHHNKQNIPLFYSAQSQSIATPVSSDSLIPAKNNSKPHTKLSHNYYARRLSIGGLVNKPSNPNPSESQLHISACRRKYSLDSNQHLLPQSFNPQAYNTNNYPQSEYAENLDNYNFTRSRSFFCKPETTMTTTTPTPMNSSFKSNLLESMGIGQNAADLESIRTFSDIYSNLSDRNRLKVPQTQQSSRSNLRSEYSNFSNLHGPNTASTTSGSNKSRNSSNSLNLPKIMRSADLGRVVDVGDSNSKRRVSFGQIELTQLEIPIVYKHSNVAFERFKLNPNFYLPDGTLKRKFSLPKLSDTLAAVQNCGYLRRHSISNSAESNSNSNSSDSENDCDVKNIFKDLQTNVSEFDVSYRE